MQIMVTMPWRLGCAALRNLPEDTSKNWLPAVATAIMPDGDVGDLASSPTAVHWRRRITAANQLDQR